VVPPVNLTEHIGKQNLNMVTWGGQATIPMVYAVSRVTEVPYAEIVASVASAAAGPGTRANIDEFTRTTAGAVAKLGGAGQGKAIIILNPAKSAMIRRDTIFVTVPHDVDQQAVADSVPADQLDDRFPGHMVGTIGDAALDGTYDLVIYIGYIPTQVAGLQGSVWVTSISTAPAPAVFTPYFRYAFGAGVLAVLFPMLVLIGTATRLAADRREERFAALRLVGGTPADIRVIASFESVVSAFCGAVLGIAVFLLVRPALVATAPIGPRYIPGTVTPTVWGYIGMLAGVPLISAIVALTSLRRVQISPLGVSRRTMPKPPGLWRLAPLVLGVGLYVYGLSTTTRDTIGTPAYPGLLLTLAGLVTAGPWLTWLASRLVGRFSRGSSALLATRRLADNPTTAFRAVTGLVLAVFLGTMVGTFVPAVNSTEENPTNAGLRNVLVDLVGLQPHAGARLLSGLGEIPGAASYPLYSPDPGGFLGPGGGSLQGLVGGGAVVSCSAIRALAVLGQCAPGVAVVQVSDGALFPDNLSSLAPFVDSTSPAFTDQPSSLPLQAVLVRVNNPATLERVRTYLTVNAPPRTADGTGTSPTPPRTFGETLQIRLGRTTTVEKIVYAAVTLILIVAGCSLAVTVGSGLVDRRRPFTLLRVSGTPVGVLSRVVLMETAVPLISATVLAAGMATVIQPSSGRIRLLGRDPGGYGPRREIRRRLGYLPQNLGYYPGFTVTEFVEYFALLKEMPPGRVSQAAAAAIERVDLGGKARAKLRTLSGGMLRRAGIAQAIVNEPELLLLDEPTAGLDPEQRVAFRALLRDLGARATVIVSTHLVEDVGAACSEVGLMEAGKIVFQDTPDELAARGEGAGAVGDAPLERGYSAVLTAARSRTAAA
jgi:ABC-type transporter Mla maintaining outer membrane lipid asymmetry ATPase subunit MlaF